MGCFVRGLVVARQCDDRELMCQAGRNGDVGAFTELVRRWEHRVLAFLTKATADADAAKDLRQEVFLRLHRYRGTYDPRYAFTTWLFRIVRNVLSTWRVREERTPWAPPVWADPADASPGPAERASRAETSQRVRGAIAQLDPCERELLLHRFDLDMSYREIAEIQGAPETTVKSRIYTLLERLRCTLDQAADERSRNP